MPFTIMLNKINKNVYSLSKRNLWTNSYGLARSSIAFSTFSTLLFNDINHLFPRIENVYSSSCTEFSIISLFCIFNEDDLFVGKWFSIIILFTVIIGWRPRVTGILHWWVCFSFFVSCPIIDGGDQLANILTLLLIPVCLFDSRKWHWHKHKNFVSGNNSLDRYFTLIALTFLAAIKVQVSVVYFQASTAKLAVDEWKDGTALYYWFTHNTFGLIENLRPFLLPLLQNSLFITFATWSVLILEILLFSALFMDFKKKMIMLILGILFHFGILIVHGLFSFFFVMLGALILYLLPTNAGLHFDKRLIKSFIHNKKATIV